MRQPTNGDDNTPGTYLFDPGAQTSVEHTEHLWEARSEGIDLVRARSIRSARRNRVREAYKRKLVAKSNATGGLLILEDG